MTPLALLVSYAPREHHLAVARVLLAAGANVRARCGYSGKDVVGYARSKRYRQLVELLEPTSVEP